MHTRLVAALLFSTVLGAGRADAQFRAPQPPAPGEDYHVELGYMFWTPTPELLIGSDAFAVVGSTQVDFVNEFNIANERFREFRASLKAGRKHKIRFSYIPIKYDATAIVGRTIIIRGAAIPVSASANATLDWDLYRIGYEWDFVARSRGLVGLIGELKYNKVAAGVSSPAFNLASTVETKAPVPSLGILVRGYPHKSFSVTGEFTGFNIPKQDNFQAKFYDFDLYGTVSLSKFLAVQAGYHSIVVDYLVDADSGNLKLKGPYFGGSIRF